MFTIIFSVLIGICFAGFIRDIIDDSWRIEYKEETIKNQNDEINYLRKRINYLLEQNDSLYGMLEDAEKELEELK